MKALNKVIEMKIEIEVLKERNSKLEEQLKEYYEIRRVLGLDVPQTKEKTNNDEIPTDEEIAEIERETEEETFTISSGEEFLFDNGGIFEDEGIKEIDINDIPAPEIETVEFNNPIVPADEEFVFDVEKIANEIVDDFKKQKEVFPLSKDESQIKKESEKECKKKNEDMKEEVFQVKKLKNIEEATNKAKMIDNIINSYEPKEIALGVDPVKVTTLKKSYSNIGNFLNRKTLKRIRETVGATSNLMIELKYRNSFFTLLQDIEYVIDFDVLPEQPIEVPEVAEVAEAPEVPEVAEVAEAPEVPEVAEVAEAPEVPEVAEVAEESSDTNRTELENFLLNTQIKPTNEEIERIISLSDNELKKEFKDMITHDITAILDKQRTALIKNKEIHNLYKKFKTLHMLGLTGNKKILIDNLELSEESSKNIKSINAI